jgi:hypothetical protein
MTEWNVVLILGELIGLFLLVGRPILTLSKTIAEFNTELKNMKARVDAMECGKHEAHNKLWQHIDEQDKELADHETRIRVLEKEG